MSPLSRAAVALLLIVPGLISSGCSRSSAARAADAEQRLSGKLTLTGSSTIAPLALAIGKRFEELHPGVRIDVQIGGSSRGIADAMSGLADVGMASRALKPDEARGLATHVVALDGVCVIVHADNPVSALTDDQVGAIYRGEVTRWSQVGGADAPITVVNKAAGRATLEVFTRHFGLDPKEIRADVVIGDNEQGVKTVAGNPGAIGYVSIGTAEYDAGAGVSIKLLPAGGVAATVAAVAAGRFPIGRPLNLVTRGELVGLRRAFLDYCRSEAVHDLIRGLYFVPARV